MRDNASVCGKKENMYRSQTMANSEDAFGRNFLILADICCSNIGGTMGS